MFQKEDTRADTNEVQQWHEESTGGQVRFDLERLREGDEFSLQRLLPSAVALGTEHGLRQLSWTPDSPDSPETTHSLGLSWAWDQADTDLSFYRRTYDSRALGAESADETEYGLDLSHSLYRDSWDLTAYLWAGSFLLARGRLPLARCLVQDRGLIRLLLPKARLPDVSLALDLNYYDSVLS